MKHTVLVHGEGEFTIPPIVDWETGEGVESHRSGRLDMEELIIISVSGHPGHPEQDGYMVSIMKLASMSLLHHGEGKKNHKMEIS